MGLGAVVRFLLRLFAETPEVEALFVRDSDSLVRGQMFQVTIESLLDYLSDQSYGANLIQIERINHQGLGVDPMVIKDIKVVETFKEGKSIYQSQ